MERNGVSAHEVRFYIAMNHAPHQWKTSREWAVDAKIAERTARAFARKFVRLGLCDVAELFPAHRYRFSDVAIKRNAAYVGRLERAREVLQCVS